MQVQAQTWPFRTDAGYFSFSACRPCDSLKSFCLEFEGYFVSCTCLSTILRHEDLLFLALEEPRSHVVIVDAQIHPLDSRAGLFSPVDLAKRG